MDNLIAIGIIVAIVGFAIWYIRKEKRQGAHCVGCPHSRNCCSDCKGCCGKCKEE